MFPNHPRMGLKSIHLLFAFVLASLLLVFSGVAQGTHEGMLGICD
jgi:hypothetical protein